MPLNTNPVAIANATILAGVSPLEVGFDGSGSTDLEGTLTYAWDFGNGDTSTEANPVYVYTASGSFTATLTVTDEGGLSDSDELVIDVEDPIVGDFALRINAGGPATSFGGNDYIADTNFVGGKVYANGSATVPVLYQTERSALPPAFGYEIPLANGEYRITLHFAEIYWGATGGGPLGTAQRIFDVAIEGATVLNDFDINAEVGPQTVLTRTFNVSISDGVLNLDLDATGADGVNQPKLSAIEIIGQSANQAPTAVATATPESGMSPLEVGFDGSGSTDLEGTLTYAWDFGNGDTSTEANPVYVYTASGSFTATLTVTDEGGLSDSDELVIDVEDPIVGDFALRINAGGPATSFGGNDYIADTNFVGGKVYANGSATVPVLYQTERSALPPAFGYEIPLANGEYRITLHFAEIYWGATGGGPLGTAQRIFDVAIEGATVLNDFDINAEVGPQTVLTRTFNVSISDGVLNLDLDATGADGVNQPKLSAIEIIGQSANQAPTAVATATPESGMSPLEVGFDGSGSTDLEGTLTYAWDFGNGDTSTEANPVYVYTASGSFTATLTVTDEGGLSDSDELVIDVEEVNLPPTAVTTATPLSGVSPLEVNFNGSGSTDVEGGLTYLWDFKDGFTSTEVNPIHTFVSVGSYNVSLLVTDEEGETDESFIGINVEEPVVTEGNCNGILTDVTNPVGSGAITSRNDFIPAEDRFKAFDNREEIGDFSKWLDAGGIPTSSSPSWIQLDLDASKRVETLVITSANDEVGRDPMDFRLMGSNGGAFTQVGSWSGQEFTQRYQSRSFELSAPGTYTTYRLEITKNKGDMAMTQLAEIKLLGCEPQIGVNIAVTGVELTPTALEMEIGTTVQLLSTVLPEEATDTAVSWSTGDPAIATVDNNGNVTAQGIGSTVITVSTNDGDFKGMSTVTVNEPVVTEGNCNGILTDVTNPVGSGAITSRNDFIPAEDRFKAFDNKDFSKWLDAGGIPTSSSPSWIQLDLDASKRVETLVITSANDEVGRDPMDFRLMGSNGGAFTQVGSWSGQEFTQRYQSRSFELSAPGTYTTYRLEITKNKGDMAMTQLAEIKLLGCEPQIGVNIAVTGVELTPTALEMEIGTTVQLLSTVLPEEATDTAVSWSTGDPAIATVDNNGNVTAQGIGSTVITVSTNDGDFKGMSTVTVNEPVVTEGNCNGILTDVTNPVGSGAITSRNDFIPAEDRFKAFDNREEIGDFSKWLDAGGIPTSSSPSWIQLDLDASKRVETLVITSANDEVGRDPMDFRLMGSNGGAFTQVGSWSGQEFTQRYQSRSFELSAPGTYTTYRLEITKNKGYIEMTQLAEIKLLGCEPQTEVSILALEAKALNQLSLYPNPVQVETSLRFDIPTQVETIQIFDVTGRLVRTIKGGLISQQGTSIDVQELPNGIYIVKARDSNSGEEFQQRMLIRR